MLAYFTLILYIAAAGGNPFLNFFMQSAIELPGFFFGSWMGKLFEIIYNNKFEIVFITIVFFSKLIRLADDGQIPFPSF